MVTSRERGWIGFTWDLLSFSTESDQDPQKSSNIRAIYQHDYKGMTILNMLLIDTRLFLILA